MKAEFESSFDSTFDPNLTREEVDASKDIISTFPIGLNPKFDMQAYFVVSVTVTKMFHIVSESRFLVWNIDARGLLSRFCHC